MRIAVAIDERGKFLLKIQEASRNKRRYRTVLVVEEEMGW